MKSPFAESVLEDAVLEWFGALGYEVAHGPSIAPDEPAAERADFREAILRGRLLMALRRLNPDLDGSALQEAERQVLTAASPALLSENRRLHRLLVDGVTVEVPHATGGVRGVQVRLIDWDETANDDWLVVNKFAVKGASVRRPDVAKGPETCPSGRSGSRRTRQRPDLCACCACC